MAMLEGVIVKPNINSHFKTTLTVKFKNKTPFIKGRNLWHTNKRRTTTAVAPFTGDHHYKLSETLIQDRT